MFIRMSHDRLKSDVLMMVFWVHTNKSCSSAKRFEEMIAMNGHEAAAALEHIGSKDH